MAEDGGVDAYIWRAQPYIDSGRFDDEEMDYKLATAERFGKVRDSVFAEEAGWPSQVGSELLKTNLSGGGWRASDVIAKWVLAEPAKALPALRDLWAEDGAAPGERVSAFLSQIPDDANFTGMGTRLRPVSVLLMALGPGYPPFKITEFRKAYKSTGYPDPSADADEGEHYEHALAFLDQLVERTTGLGLERPRNRLEAHSVVWMNETAEPPPPPPPGSTDGGGQGGSH